MGNNYKLVFLMKSARMEKHLVWYNIASNGSNLTIMYKSRRIFDKEII